MVPALHHPTPFMGGLRPTRDRYFDDPTRLRIQWAALAGFMFLISLLVLVEGSRNRWIGPPVPAEIVGLLTPAAMSRHAGASGRWTVICGDAADCAQVSKAIRLSGLDGVQMPNAGAATSPGVAVIDPFGRHYATLPRDLGADALAVKLTALSGFFERETLSRRF